MYFKGTIYDPSTSATHECDIYTDFINKIQEIAEHEVSKTNPPDEENTYLWVKVNLSETKEGLDITQVPFFRLNKILFQWPYNGRRNPYTKGATLSSEILDEDELKAIYPSRSTASMYITALANLNLNSQEITLELEESIETNETIYENIIVLSEKDIQYPKEEQFNCNLSVQNLMHALNKLQEILDPENGVGLLQQTSYKKALVTVCFFISESARFKLVQYAGMNLLNIDHNAENMVTRSYQSWCNWKPLILYWSDICDYLDKNGHRVLKPKLQLGVPISISTKDCTSINLLREFSQDASIHAIQIDVLNDFYQRSPQVFHYETAIFPREADREKNWCYTLQQIVLNKIDSLKEEANQLVTDKNLDKAIEKFLNALSLCENELPIVDVNLTLYLNYKVGYSYCAIKDYAKAISYLDKSLSIAMTVYSENHDKTLGVKTVLELCHNKIAEQPEIKLKETKRFRT